jgi:hypothetical protein
MGVVKLKSLGGSLKVGKLGEGRGLLARVLLIDGSISFSLYSQVGCIVTGCMCTWH